MGWGRVLVEGDSMLPALRAGDRCLVRWGSPVAVGDVVVARRPDRPGRLVVKRVTARHDDGWWLEGDNQRASHDSWLFGAVPDRDVLGRVMLRYRPSPRRLRPAPPP
jgi:nickel-type superoxide dismutase maturation protease